MGGHGDRRRFITLVVTVSLNGATRTKSQGKRHIEGRNCILSNPAQTRTMSQELQVHHTCLKVPATQTLSSSYCTTSCQKWFTRVIHQAHE